MAKVKSETNTKKDKAVITCSGVSMHPKQNKQNYEQALHGNLGIALHNFHPDFCNSLRRFDKSFVPLITSSPLDADTVEDEFSRRIVQNAIDIQPILTPSFQLNLSKEFLNGAIRISDMQASETSVIFENLCGASFIADFLSVLLEEQGYSLIHRYFGEIELFYRTTQELGIPLFYPNSLSAFEFLIGGSAFKSPEKLGKNITNDRDFQYLLLKQIHLTASKTLKNYSPNTFSKCQKYILKIEDIKDSFEHSLIS